jgi:hypothetical protein
MMNDALKVTRLHYIQREISFVVPIIIMALVVIVSILVALVMQRIGLNPDSTEWKEGFQNNGGAFWSFPGFFVYLGVQAIASTFPFGMALGTTRKAYAAGTALFFLLQAAYIAALGLVLFALERLTDGWFVSAYVFNVNMLGSGNVPILLWMIFTVAFFSLSIGGVFGALFVKAGTKGPMILAIALILAVAVLLVILAPQLGAIFRSLTFVRVGAGFLAIGVAAAVGQYLGLRSASVR